MIITRTPFRVSFFGGGTDYPVWFKEYGGAVLSTTINKYCYITCRYLPPFFHYKYRIRYTSREETQSVDEIKHPSVRECIRYLNLNKGVEMVHISDIPAQSGMGSSSSFTVGFLNALYALKGGIVSKRQLAHDAIHLEQNVLKENVGSQDQVAVAFGGFNKIEFSGNNDFKITPITILGERLKILQEHLMLIFSGFSRTASEVAAEQIKTTPQKHSELNTMFKMVDDAVAILGSNRDIVDFGRLLHESWILKRSLSAKVSTSKIDEIYEIARSAGATGGKLLGAGGGGFMLFFVKPECRQSVKQKLHGLVEVPFSFENYGSHVVFYNPVE